LNFDRTWHARAMLDDNVPRWKWLTFGHPRPR